MKISFNKKIMAMSLASLFSSTTYAAFDLVTLMDESGSMQGQQEYTSAFITAFDDALVGSEFTNNLYGLIGLSSVNSSGMSEIFNVGSGLFGTSSEFNEAFKSINAIGSLVDGYSGIDTAESDYAPLYTTDNTHSLLYVSNASGREVTTSTSTEADIRSKLNSTNSILTSITEVKITDAQNRSLLVAFKDSATGQLVGYFVNDQGALELSSDSVEFVDSGTNGNFSQLALDSGGVIGDLSKMSDVEQQKLFATALARGMTGIEDLNLDINLVCIFDCYDEQQSAIETTAKSALKSQVTNVMNVITSHFKQLRTGTNGQFSINNATYSPSTGMNAGEGVSGLALWFTPTYSSSNNTQAKNHGSRYDETNVSYLAGIDYVVNTDVVIGAMAGYEKSDADMNNGGSIEKDGAVFSLYGAYNWSDQTIWYVQGGYGNPDSEIKDMTSGSLITGKYDSDKFFAGLGAIYNTQYNDYNVTLDGGFNWARESIDKYTGSDGVVVNPDDVDLNLININAEVSKPLSWAEVYVSAGAEFDLTSNSNDNSLIDGEDEFGGVVGGGLRFNPSKNLFGEIAGGYKVFRAYEHGGYSINATLRYQF